MGVLLVLCLSACMCNCLPPVVRMWRSWCFRCSPRSVFCSALALTPLGMAQRSRLLLDVFVNALTRLPIALQLSSPVVQAATLLLSAATPNHQFAAAWTLESLLWVAQCSTLLRFVSFGSRASSACFFASRPPMQTTRSAGPWTTAQFLAHLPSSVSHGIPIVCLCPRLPADVCVACMCDCNARPSTVIWIFESFAERTIFGRDTSCSAMRTTPTRGCMSPSFMRPNWVRCYEPLHTSLHLFKFSMLHELWFRLWSEVPHTCAHVQGNSCGDAMVN